jgi:polar amino acid transport system substrate-binding protein
MRVAGWIGLAGLWAAVLAQAPGAQARNLDAILSAGELRIGVNPNYPPSAMYDDKNELVGFDVDLGRRIAGMLGVKPQFVIVDPASRVPFVTADKIDIVMGGMTRTPDRAKVIDFSVPVNTEGSAVLTTEGAPFQSIADMDKEQVTFTEVRVTTPVAFLQAKLPKAKLLFLDDWTDALRAVATGRANALVADPAFYETLLPNFPDTKWQTLRGVAGPVAYDCVGLAHGNDALRRWLNVALFQLQTAGFIDDEWRQWHHASMAAPIVPQPYF